MAGKTYYVSGTGNDQNDGLKEGAAFRTLQKAGDLVQAGDTVYVMNGTYEQTKYFNSPILNIYKKNGTSDAPITFTAYPGHDPVIKSANFQAIQVMASSYIVIEGLTLVGNNDQITLKYAQEQQANTNNPATNGLGIYVGPDNKTGIRSHHVVIKDNTISKFPSSGIATSSADYVTIENNLVFETCFYSPWGANAISLLFNSDVDTNTTDYKMIVRGNVSHSNYTFIPWKDVESGKATEGSGIMIDLGDGAGNDGVAYKGKTLIANNVSYNNGGAGIQVFKSSNVDVLNNTTYKNANHPDEAGHGEILINSATKVRVENNIMYAKLNGESFTGSDKQATTNNNLIYNTTKWAFAGTNTITGKDPLFVDAAKGNFALKPGSAAIDAGSSTFNGITKIVPQDGDGNGTAVVDIGAYEAPRLVITAPEIQVLNGTVNIADGSTTAISFGDTIVGDTLTKTFTIQNIGTSALNLSNLKLPDGFSLVGTLPTTVAAKASTTISVALNTTTPGTYSGSLSLNNNDSNESPFDFAISGTVKPAPIPVLNGNNNSNYLKGNAPANKIYGFGGNDIIVGGTGNDQLWGGDGLDTLWGGNGNDLLYGDSGNDKLSGDNDNDTLFGGLGDDQLLGGAGNDWLYGSEGKDVLTGGYNVDTFVLTSGQGTDSISDFKVGTDKLALSGGLKFGQLLIQQEGSQALIVDGSDNQVLVKLDNVTSTMLLAQTSTTFITI